MNSRLREEKGEIAQGPHLVSEASSSLFSLCETDQNHFMSTPNILGCTKISQGYQARKIENS